MPIAQRSKRPALPCNELPRIATFGGVSWWVLRLRVHLVAPSRRIRQVVKNFTLRPPVRPDRAAGNRPQPRVVMVIRRPSTSVPSGASTVAGRVATRADEHMPKPFVNPPIPFWLGKIWPDWVGLC